MVKPWLFDHQMFLCLYSGIFCFETGTYLSALETCFPKAGIVNVFTGGGHKAEDNGNVVLLE